MWTARLSLKITLAVVRDEERTDGSVAIVDAEIPVAAVEPAEIAIGPPGFEDGSADGPVPQLLCKTQILSLADSAEFMPVLLIVFVELSLAAKAWAGSVEQDCEEQTAGDSNGARGHGLWNRPLALDRQPKPLQHGFDVLFTEARSVVFDIKLIE
jgi:hypothetical protein